MAWDEFYRKLEKKVLGDVLGESSFTNSAVSTSDFSLESVKRTMDELNGLMKHGADVLLLTSEVFDLLKVVVPAAESVSGVSVFGIPYEVFPTLAELGVRAMELYEQGKRVAIVDR
jgi:methionine synthase I (cobalamin-dependent)